MAAAKKASTYLKFDNLLRSTFQRTGDVKLQVQFVDDVGNPYHWVPRWEDVISLLEGASNVEILNKRGSSWLVSFANAVKSVLANAQQLFMNAQKVYGSIDSISEGNIVVVPLRFDPDEWGWSSWADKRDAIYVPASFPIDVDWCIEHLGKAADVLIVDGYIVCVRLRAPEVP